MSMKTVRLGDICDIVSGGTPSRSKLEFWQNGTIPWIKIGNIKGKYVSEADEYITKVGLDGSSAKMLSKGTILYTIFATLGEVGILEIEACTNQAIAGISIREPSKTKPDYLYYYLKSKKNYVNGIGRGVAQNNINMSMLRDFSVPLPTIEQQEEIVCILDGITEVIDKRQQQLSAFDDLIKARFVEMFVDKGYPEKTIHDVLSASFWLMPATPEFINDGEIPYITSKNIKNRKIDFDNVKYISWDDYASISSNRPTQIGDILISMIGTLGQTAVITDDRPFYGQNLYLLRLDRTVIDTDYFCEFFNSEQAQHDLLNKRNQSTQAYLKANHVEDLRLPVAPIDLQKRFSDFVKQVDKSKVVVQNAQNKAQLLFDSLMQQYFG